MEVVLRVPLLPLKLGLEVFNQLLLQVLDLESDLTVQDLQALLNHFMNQLLRDCLRGGISADSLALLHGLRELLLHELHVLVLLGGGLLYLFEVHVQRLRVALDFLHTLDDLFLENLLTLLHFVHFFVERLRFRGGGGTSGRAELSTG